MKSSRRSFLATGLVLPAAGLAIPRPDKPALPSAAPASPDKLTYRVLKTGLKVTTVGFGCMITSDGSVVERAADLGITISTPRAATRAATTSAWWAPR
jgi:hypothetical protein